MSKTQVQLETAVGLKGTGNGLIPFIYISAFQSVTLSCLFHVTQQLKS